MRELVEISEPGTLHATKDKKIVVEHAALSGRQTSKLSISTAFTVSTNTESSQNIAVTAVTVH